MCSGGGSGGGSAPVVVAPPEPPPPPPRKEPLEIQTRSAGEGGRKKRKGGISDLRIRRSDLSMGEAVVEVAA